MVAFAEGAKYILFKELRVGINPRGAMVKLVALFRKSESTGDFDAALRGKIVPLLRQVPGLQRIEVTKITGAAYGESKYHVMAELYFADRPALDAALASREGKAVARELLQFAAEVSSLFHGTIDEELDATPA